jgi:hypothetical protein
MIDTDPLLMLARAAARRLVGDSAEVHRIQSAGRNSRIFHVASGGTSYALKQYPSKEFDPHDRLATEVGALRLMENAKLDTVPRVVAVDTADGYALLSWIDGTEVTGLNDGDIDAAVAFLASFHNLRGMPWAAEQPAAAEACLSAAEINRQLAARRARLQTLITTEPELIDFLDKSFDPAYRDLLAQAKAELAAARLNFSAELPQERRTLVPSDFGFHNSLRRPDGSLAFVDFEYFGWDDPVKITADVMLHPGHRLAAPHRRRFRQSALALYCEDPTFAARLAALFPLYGLRWVLILLNEFIPERWQNRVLAGSTETWSQAKARQIKRARGFLTSLTSKVEA